MTPTKNNSEKSLRSAQRAFAKLYIKEELTVSLFIVNITMTSFSPPFV